MTAYRIQQGRAGRSRGGKQGPQSQKVPLPAPQPDLEEQFFEEFIASLPRQVKTGMLLADREFGRSGFFALLKRRQCPFVIRTRGYIRIRYAT
ncbi:MAG: hypothetical protein NZT92_01995 [Abditibacteriales bacterium]|nr:hypothetical protein [Abditibacteriales bacterium]MDW8364656.1 hypothetical protein [Abditibacteriales bacterium]